MTVCILELCTVSHLRSSAKDLQGLVSGERKQRLIHVDLFEAQGPLVLEDHNKGDIKGPFTWKCDKTNLPLFQSKKTKSFSRESGKVVVPTLFRPFRPSRFSRRASGTSGGVPPRKSKGLEGVGWEMSKKQSNSYWKHVYVFSKPLYDEGFPPLANLRHSNPILMDQTLSAQEPSFSCRKSIFSTDRFVVEIFSQFYLDGNKQRRGKKNCVDLTQENKESP